MTDQEELAEAYEAYLTMEKLKAERLDEIERRKAKIKWKAHMRNRNKR